jgi:hypothetical protein
MALDPLTIALISGGLNFAGGLLGGDEAPQGRTRADRNRERERDVIDLISGRNRDRFRNQVDTSTLGPRRQAAAFGISQMDPLSNPTSLIKQRAAAAGRVSTGGDVSTEQLNSLIPSLDNFIQARQGISSLANAVGTAPIPQRESDLDTILNDPRFAGLRDRLINDPAFGDQPGLFENRRKEL